MTEKIRIAVVDRSEFFVGSIKRELVDNKNVQFVGGTIKPNDIETLVKTTLPDVILAEDFFIKNEFFSKTNLPVIVMSFEEILVDERKNIASSDFVKKPPAGVILKMFVNVVAAKAIILASKLKKKSSNGTLDAKANDLSASKSEKNPSAKTTIEKISLAGNNAKKKPDLDENRRLDFTEKYGTKEKKFPKRAPVMPTADEIARLEKAAKNGYIVALGASTGGTDALECIIKSFPENMPPVVVVQHMPPVFTKLYSERLNKICKVNVSEAFDGKRLERGDCVIAAGALQMQVKKDNKGYYLKVYAGEKVSGHCPSVDVMFTSLAKAAGTKCVAALMTGMGSDGAKGLLEIRTNGGYTIGQNEESCVVYGMPMEAYKLGACEIQLSLEIIGKEICKFLSSK